MKPRVAAILCLSVVACAPNVPVLVVLPAPDSAGEPQPTSDVSNEAAVTPRDGTGVIVITRDKKWLGAKCIFDVSLDDQHVAGLRSGEQVTLFADPGERIVGVSIRDEGDCDTAVAQVPVKVVAHSTKTIEVGEDGRYDLKVELNTHGGALPR
jgi:hypothetical protein